MKKIIAIAAGLTVLLSACAIKQVTFDSPVTAKIRVEDADGYHYGIYSDKMGSTGWTNKVTFDRAHVGDSSITIYEPELNYLLFKK
jgi:hypothetical protein